jgi:alkylated DNA repair protein alkB family protein 6
MAYDLDAARITSLPDDAFYIPNFISEEEEQILLQKVTLSNLVPQYPLTQVEVHDIHSAQISTTFKPYP